MSDTPVVRGPYHVIKTRTFTDNAVFEPRPSSLVLIAGLEVVVSDSFGTYLLVSSPSCERVETQPGRVPAKPEDAFWTVPYITKTVKAPDDGFKNVRPAIDAIDRAIKSWKPETKLLSYAETFSIGATAVKLVGEFCELKRSWSQPNVTVLYHIMRYSLQLGNCAQHNLADATSRKGYSFLPIDDDRYRRVTRSRKCKTHERQETLYLSQPLTSNLSAILDDAAHRRSLHARSVALQPEHFSKEYTGILFCGDIAGYGAASAYAATHMHSFDEMDHGAVLRDSATVGFTDLFLEAGIAQVHTAGDGFICALPLAKEREMVTELKRFVRAYAAYLTRLDHLSDRIAEHFKHNAQGGEPPPTLGSRLAIHYGKYRYGKMSEAASLLTSFDGRKIVTVSRLEQGLSAISKSPTLACQYGITGDHHLAVASTDITELVGESAILPDLFENVALVEAASKEYSGDAMLMRRVQPQPEQPSKRQRTRRAKATG